MNKEKLEIWKEKYKKEWEKFKALDNGEKLFYDYIKTKEKQKKIQEKLKAQAEKEKKREARALIILAKLLLKELDKEQLQAFIERHSADFIQKERGKEINYSKYILKLLNQ
jgi:hypothetical protein